MAKRRSAHSDAAIDSALKLAPPVGVRDSRDGFAAPPFAASCHGRSSAGVKRLPFAPPPPVRSSPAR